MKILIAIHGAHCEPERMAAQRDTWLKDLQGADYRYFLGKALPGRIPSGSDSSPVSHEQGFDTCYLDSPDGPLWEGCRRTMVLNRKTEALATYALDHGYDFVFKCDDDTHVFVDRLLASGFEGHDYTGNMDRHHARDVGWYHWAQGGAGYWLSRAAMQVIAANGLQQPPGAEDFAVGQLLARHGFAAHHDDRYIPAAIEQQLSNPDREVITLHKVDPRWMRRLHTEQ